MSCDVILVGFGNFEINKVKIPNLGMKKWVQNWNHNLFYAHKNRSLKLCRNMVENAGADLKFRKLCCVPTKSRSFIDVNTTFNKIRACDVSEMKLELKAGAVQVEKTWGTGTLCDSH